MFPEKFLPPYNFSLSHCKELERKSRRSLFAVKTKNIDVAIRLRSHFLVLVEGEDRPIHIAEFCSKLVVILPFEIEFADRIVSFRLYFFENGKTLFKVRHQMSVRTNVKNFPYI